jgi:hypothetical protein
MARYLGRHTIGIDQRTGKKVRYADLVEDGEIKGILTTREERDAEHPQKFARRIPLDRLNIRRPSPEPIIGAVSVIANSGGSADLWEGNQTALHLSLVMGEVVVTPSAGLAPVSTIAPVISGTVSQGAQLSTDNGSWDNSPTGYTYQWYADGGAIPGATSSTYQIAAIYVGSTLHVVVTATNNNGSASRASNFTSAVTEADFTVNSGNIALEGQSVLLGSTRELLVTSDDIALTGSSVTLRAGRKLAVTSGGISAAGQSVTLTHTTVAVMILDDVTASSTGAYSTIRRLRTGYTGSLIRVRRSSDNTEQDIGYGGDNYLDQSALTTFVGANSGFITKIYDQSGNTRDLAQSTSGNQPRIINAGTLSAINGLPAAEFYDSNKDLTSGIAVSNFITAAAYTAVCVARPTAGSGTTYQGPPLWAESGGYWYATMNATSMNIGHWDGANKAATVNVSYPFKGVVTARRGSGETVRASINGGTETQSGAANNVQNVTGTMRVGIGYLSARFTGNMSELVIFASKLSDADLNDYGSNAATLIGETWTTV